MKHHNTPLGQTLDYIKCSLMDDQPCSKPDGMSTKQWGKLLHLARRDTGINFRINHETGVVRPLDMSRGL